MAFACLLPAGAGAATASHGGATANDPQFQPPKRAKIRNGKAIAPRGAPKAVRRAIKAANRIAKMPYRYGGGHGSFEDTGYDCSGSISYALHGGGLLDTPLDSSSFAGFGVAGKGKWITVYTNPGHAFVMIAGLRFDTGYNGRGRVGRNNSRWSKKKRPTGGYTKRHPAGL